MWVKHLCPRLLHLSTQGCRMMSDYCLYLEVPSVDNKCCDWSTDTVSPLLTSLTATIDCVWVSCAWPPGTAVQASESLLTWLRQTETDSFPSLSTYLPSHLPSLLAHGTPSSHWLTQSLTYAAKDLRFLSMWTLKEIFVFYYFRQWLQNLG